MDAFLDALKEISNGVPITLFFVVISIFIAFILSLLITACNILCNKFIRNIIKVYTTVITGTPLLIQLFLIYYGPAQFDFIRESFLWEYLSSPYVCGFLALIINSTAYASLIFTGAFTSIDKKQWEASKALGLNKVQIYTLLLPYAVRRALPTYSNEIIAVFKSSSLISIITIMDIMGYARQFNADSYNALAAFSAAGVIYLIISAIFILIMRFIESKWLKYSV